MLSGILHSSFVRQILGAGAGALIALAAYQTYKFTVKHVHAMLVDEPFAEETVEQDAGITPLQVVAIPDPQPVEPEPTEPTETAEDTETTQQPTQVAAVVAEETNARMHSGAPNLPQSGIGLWSAMIAALAITTVAVRKTRTKLAASRV